MRMKQSPSEGSRPTLQRAGGMGWGGIFSQREWKGRENGAEHQEAAQTAALKGARETQVVIWAVDCCSRWCNSTGTDGDEKGLNKIRTKPTGLPLKWAKCRLTVEVIYITSTVSRGYIYPSIYIYISISIYIYCICRYRYIYTYILYIYCRYIYRYIYIIY